MVYENYISSFEDLLKVEGGVTIHHTSVSLVATRMFDKVKNASARKSRKTCSNQDKTPKGQVKSVSLI